jgi:probable phosphoglycerate mutase
VLIASMTRPRPRALHTVCDDDPSSPKAAVAHAMGTHLDLFQRIVISPCSVSAIAYTDGGPIVLTVNSSGDSLAEMRPS